MTRIDALGLLYQYCDYLKSQDVTPHHLWTGQMDTLNNAQGMFNRFPLDGSEKKAMRWLGYMQGVLVMSGIFTLDQVKEHSRTKEVS